MSRPIRVLLVTSWGTACGIAEHAYYLQQAVQAADAGIRVDPCATYLDPDALFADAEAFDPLYDEAHPDLVHLNYQASLHSRWTVTEIARLRQRGIPVVVTYHDTGVPNSDHAKAICAVADAFVVHEPYADLGEVCPSAGHYWRMGVPDSEAPTRYAARPRTTLTTAWQPIAESDRSTCFLDWDGQPILGSIGFPFPWKNYDRLAEITAQVGWALLLIAPGATPEQVRGWRDRNPALCVHADFVPRRQAISLLTGCDATAFAYVCHNTGQSGAILQGIAARKPVLAFDSTICRQFLALALDGLGSATIRWARSVDHLTTHLRTLPIGRVDPGIVALAAQESWAQRGRNYADLYRSLL